MRQWRRTVCWGWICLVVWIPEVQCQLYLVLDTVRIPLMMTSPSGGNGLFKYNLKTGLDYSLTASLFSIINGAGSAGQGQFTLQQGLRYLWVIADPEHLSISNSYSHRLGIQHWFDSTSRIFPDENMLRTRLEYRVEKWAGITLDSELGTCLLNHWERIRIDSSRTARLLTSSFLSPMIWTFAGGISLRIPETGSVMAGITGGRLTLLRDTSVFAGKQAASCYGVKRGTNHLFEYGISLRFQADRIFWKILRWNCDLLVFKGYDKPADLNLKNIFEVRLASYIVISVQTRLLYEEDISRQLQVENMLSAGFMIKR